MLGLLGAGRAAAQGVGPAASCKNKGKNCNRDRECCSNICQNGECKCAGTGGFCDKDQDCCSRDCQNGNCRQNGGGGGGNCKNNGSNCKLQPRQRLLLGQLQERRMQVR
jgi:hypothetical protein